MRNSEQYKRLIRFLMVGILFSVEMIIYYFVWIKCYNDLMQIAYDVKGNYMIAAVYGIVLILFCRVYGGLRIGYLRVGNLIFSHILATTCANAMTYLQIILLVKRFCTIWPLFFMMLLEYFVIAFRSAISTRIYRRIYPPRKVLLVYGERPISSLMNKINSREDRFEICGTVHTSQGLENIEAMVEQYEGVVIGDVKSDIRNQLLKYCYEKSVRTYTMPKISDILIRSAESLHLFDTPLLLSRNTGLNIEQRVIKRFMDICCSLLALVVTSPIMALTALSIKLYDKGPVLFRQKRCTENGRIFEIYKFRSMIVDAEKDGRPIPATEKDPRITPVGYIIRTLRIDELPQFINILKGDMSLVGPRPERIEHVDKYTKAIPEFGYRLKVKGGLTGYAQVYGKYNTTAYDKLKMDLMYIENYSILLDIEILFQTVKILLMRESTEGFSDASSMAMYKREGILNDDDKQG
ncbi:MAG: sugar transferase [Enterocloster sp.]